MKTKNIITVLVCAVFILTLSAVCFFGKKADYSESERRVLASFPKASWQNVSSGKFASGFEEYATDRFPYRDIWRSIKAYVRTGAFFQTDNNGIYTQNGHVSKLEYPMNTQMIDHAVGIFDKVKEKYLADNDIYVSLIPDKNMFLSSLKFDYKEFEKYLYDNMEYAKDISILDLLSEDDYYYTDTHWRQDCIIDIADRIASGMGSSILTEYEKIEVDTPFNGVYVGQSALNVKPDTITYLSNDTIRSFQVEGANAVYDIKKADSRDPYELFLSGNQPVVTIKNPDCENGKRLIVFRDSFGSSIAPLLATGYAETVLIDLRYINSAMLDEFVNFENADVLFLYSTVLLNNSLAIK